MTSAQSDTPRTDERDIGLLEQFIATCTGARKFTFNEQGRNRATTLLSVLSAKRELRQRDERITELERERDAAQQRADTFATGTTEYARSLAELMDGDPAYSVSDNIRAIVKRAESTVRELSSVKEQLEGFKRDAERFRAIAECRIYLDRKGGGWHAIQAGADTFTATNWHVHNTAEEAADAAISALDAVSPEQRTEG